MSFALENTSSLYHFTSVSNGKHQYFVPIYVSLHCKTRVVCTTLCQFASEKTHSLYDFLSVCNGKQQKYVRFYVSLQWKTLMVCTTLYHLQCKTPVVCTTLCQFAVEKTGTLYVFTSVCNRKHQ